MQKGTLAQDIQAEPAYASEAVRSASQQREQQGAAAAADDVGTSWAAWRADQTGEVGSPLPLTISKVDADVLWKAALQVVVWRHQMRMYC